MADYIPTSDADFDDFQLNFNTKIQLSAGTYGLDFSYASALAPLSADFHSKLAIAVDPATRTPVTIAAKDASEVALKSFIRVGVGICQATPAVTNEAKEDLRIPLHNNPPTPVPAPTTYPVIAANTIGPRATLLKLSDSLAPGDFHKPTGVMGMAFFAKTTPPGAPPITDPEELVFRGVVTRTHAKREWTNDEAGKVMYMAGIWMTGSGKIGPWSPITSTNIAA